jgi:enediyne biosynthesis protein E2
MPADREPAGWSYSAAATPLATGQEHTLVQVLGALRQLALAPSLEKVSFGGRGFAVPPSEISEKLEAVPQAVVCGFEWAIAAPDVRDVRRRLRLVDPEQQGFAYEGATMAFTILDSVRGNRTAELLSGPGERHIFLAYIGIGFAMARLPRPLWKKVLPDLTDSHYFPTMSWLAVDGYGFDKAYFDTERYVDHQEPIAAYPWDGDPDYFCRAVDQGIGRALWFIHGADTDKVTAAVGAFDRYRQADLWSGVGLAATFAGGGEPAALAALVQAAGEHAPELALGSVFAVKARTYAGFVPPHTMSAADAFTGLSVEQATEVADSTEVVGPISASEPRYELWRREIRTYFTRSAGQVSATH